LVRKPEPAPPATDPLLLEIHASAVSPK
jgi:hypothetical protein